MENKNLELNAPELFREIADALEHGIKGAWAVITDAGGSTPREPGSKMLIFEDGSTKGTIGGGSLEHETIKKALEIIVEDGKAVAITYNLKEDIGMECGGSVTVYVEPFSSLPRLLIFGGGHVGSALYSLCPLLGLSPVIVDDRPEFCTAEKFPGAKTICALPAQALNSEGTGKPLLTLNEEDFAVVMTYKHAHDFEAVAAVLAQGDGHNLPVRYLGVIGSRKKVAKLKENLKEKGFIDELIAKLNTPVGLNLGGRSPGEIAVSIAAEMIAVRYGKNKDELGWQVK